MGNDVINKLIITQIKELNSSIPKRRPIVELLNEGTPESVTKSGEKYFFDKNEIRSIAKLIPRYKYDSLELPIYLYVDPEVEDQVYVTGETDIEVIKKLLNLGERYKPIDGKLWLPKVMARNLRLKYKTCVHFFWLL